MNRYVLRTSLFWLLLFTVAGAVYVYRIPRSVRPTAVAGDVQPIASGPTEDTNKVAPPTATTMEAPLVPMQLTNDQMNSIGARTSTVEYKQLDDRIRATGTVEADERLQSSVQVRFSGYVRKVFADATYQYVRKGQPLFTIYSPELVATEQDYLLARRNQAALSGSSVDGVASGASSLVAAAERRLQQWDIPESEIAKLEATGKPITELAIDSPASGYVMERNVLPNMYVEPSTKLYSIADLSPIWVNAQVFQNDVASVKRGSEAAVTVDTYPGRTFQASVEQILPQVDMTTRTVNVRLAVRNPDIVLKPGMFVNVELQSSLGRQLVVPASAVFQTGLRNIVFIDHGNGSLEPKDVTLGARVGDDFPVLKGLQLHQQIVTSANFLLDSESQLQAAAGSYAPPPPGAGQQPPINSAGSQPAISIDFTTVPNPAHKGANTFHVRLSTPNGQPVVGAQVTVTFFMPAMPSMGMGAMNTTSQLTPKSAGIYEGTGVLQSGGTWQVTVTARQHGQLIGTKQMHVGAEGSM